MPIALKSLAGHLLRRRGYHVFRQEHLPQANLSLHLKRLFATQQIDCVFDVGANHGEYRDFLREAVGYEGLVVSIEPIPYLRSELESRASADTKWVVLSCAAGRTPGLANFNVMKGDKLSSFRTPTTAATTRFKDSNTVASVEQVQVRRLDEIYRELRDRFRFERPYLKIDTQGFDLEVVEGASGCLGDIVALQSETSVTPLYEDAPELLETLAYFQQRGFALSFLSPVGVDQTLRLLDCDCVFVNPGRIRSVAVERN